MFKQRFGDVGFTWFDWIVFWWTSVYMLGTTYNSTPQYIPIITLDNLYSTQKLPMKNFFAFVNKHNVFVLLYQ